MLKLINEFLREKQPSRRMTLADKLKKLLSREDFSKIMQAQLLKIDNKFYYYNKTQNKYTKC